jgi:hypothetical protein
MKLKNVCMCLLFIFLVGLPLQIFGQGSSGQDINKLYKEGMKAYQDKDFALYLERFETLNQLRANHPVIMYNLAGAFAMNKVPKKALALLEKLILVNANRKIQEDSDFDNIKDTQGFKDLLKKIELAWKPVNNSKTAFTIKERDLHLESIAYDGVKKRFYVSSVHKRKILTLNEKGKWVEFTTQGQDGLYGVLGIRIDAQKRILWASNSAMPQMLGFNKETKGQTAVHAYHLDTGKLLHKYSLADGRDHNFDDVALHPDGSVYVSDTKAIYLIDPVAKRLERFISDPSFRSLQGIDFCDKGTKILAADWSSGLFLIDIKEKKVVSKVSHPDDISLKGIDGLYYLEDSNSLLAIQNGVKPMRVLQLYLDKGFQKVNRYRIHERANPLFNEPTLGVMIGNMFYYVANSQWGAYNKDSSIFPHEKLQDIIILKLPIGK